MDRLEGRMEALEHKLDHGLDSRGRRIVESEVRTVMAITALSAQVGDLVQMLNDDRNLRQRVERCKTDIAVTKAKLPK